jgi:OOP family OmpA-OmpF porin
MQGERISTALGVALVATIWSGHAMAQEATAADLMALDTSALRQEITTRYDAALALTLDPSVVSADSNQYMWASQAKAQCGIALGFLRSSTKDPVSIGKCVDAYNRMRQRPIPVQVQAPLPPQRSTACDQPIAGIVFFEFDSDVPPESAVQTLNAVVGFQRECNWQRLTVTGHADRSGSNPYNDALSVRRANAVANVLESMGMPRAVLEVAGRGETEPKVPTADGERNPSNRRVEVTVR